MTAPDGHKAETLSEPLSVNESSKCIETDPPDTERSDGIMNDHQLLAAYVQGDERAFETLVEKYFRMVYTVAARQTGDTHLAEEIAQSVFLILSRKARGFSSRSSVPGWLLRTTRFVGRDAIKMRRRRDEKERELAASLEHQLETKSDPSNLELLLEEAIQALPPDEQAGIVARFFEGKDFQEIAEMFAITEDAARKRTSRCLAKLQVFMEKRGARIAVQTLSGLLLVPPVDPAGTQALESAIRATHAAWKGHVAGGNAVALANHAARLLRWRFWGGVGLKYALPAFVLLAGAWAFREWHRPASGRIETLGQAWGALDQRVAQHRQFLMRTDPNSPNYQARVQEELGAISRESSRIIGELQPLLKPPEERTRLAQFLTAELVDSLKMDPKQKAALFAYIQKRLTPGASLKDAMKALAETTQTETTEIKAMLSPGQQQLFDQIYGADGVLLFSYAKALALGQIGQ